MVLENKLDEHKSDAIAICSFVSASIEKKTLRSHLDDPRLSISTKQSLDPTSSCTTSRNPNSINLLPLHRLSPSPPLPPPLIFLFLLTSYFFLSFTSFTSFLLHHLHFLIPILLLSILLIPLLFSSTKFPSRLRNFSTIFLSLKE